MDLLEKLEILKFKSFNVLKIRKSELTSLKLYLKHLVSYFIVLNRKQIIEQTFFLFLFLRKHIYSAYDNEIKLTYINICHVKDYRDT